MSALILQITFGACPHRSIAVTCGCATRHEIIALLKCATQHHLIPCYPRSLHYPIDRQAPPPACLRGPLKDNWMTSCARTEEYGDFSAQQMVYARMSSRMCLHGFGRSSFGLRAFDSRQVGNHFGSPAGGVQPRQVSLWACVSSVARPEAPRGVISMVFQSPPLQRMTASTCTHAPLRLRFDRVDGGAKNG